MKEDWRSPNYRQKISTKFDDSIRHYKMTTSHTAWEMEDHIFQKSRTQEEYLGYVARLLLFIREKGSSQQTTDLVNSGNLVQKYMSFEDFQNRDWSCESFREFVTDRIQQVINENFINPSVFRDWREREEFLDFAVSLILDTCDENPFEGEPSEE